MKKLVNYLPFVALFILPLLFYPGVNTSGWRSSGDVHALLEFASSLLALTAGIMVLLHFFTTGRWFFLIISIGFVLIGAEEFVHWFESSLDDAGRENPVYPRLQGGALRPHGKPGFIPVHITGFSACLNKMMLPGYFQ